jgi:hypothetical protein
MRRRLTSHSAVFASFVALVWGLGIAACSSQPARPTRTDAQLREHAAADAMQSRAMFHDAVDRVLARAQQKIAAQDGAATLDLLAMSGGGDYGAFGAGFLVGWGSIQDPAWQKPDFDLVTGVSTGAILAPFAYVGTEQACRAVEEFYRNPQQDWIRGRGLLFFLPSNPSFMAIKGLERDVGKALDAGFIEQMAQQSRKGKVLAVSATDLDLGRKKVWSLGPEAEFASASGDLDRVHRMLLASAAIPAVFPPVEIDGELYADGGVTANVLVGLDASDPEGLIQRWKAAHPNERLPKIRYWIIFNNQKTHPAKTVQKRWPNIISPSLATATRSATLAEIRWLASEADYTNTMHETSIEVRVVAIPDDWRPPVEGDFRRETMVSLSDLGRKMGADPTSWHLWTVTNGGQPEGGTGEPAE